MSDFQISAPENCTIAGIASVHAGLVEAAQSQKGVVLDVSGVTSADITFVQLVVSMAKTMQAGKRSFTVSGAGSATERAFARAGIPFDAAAGRVVLQ